MNNEWIYLSPPNVNDHEEQLVVNALRSGWVAPVGPALDQFELRLSNWHGADVVALNSGTSALHLAMRACGVGEGTKVLVSDFTFVAAINAVLYQGGEVVVIDSESKNWGVDPELLRQRLLLARQKQEKVAAVVVTHIFGVPAQIEAITQVCEDFGVDLIEDAAEAFGVNVNGRALGTFGRFGVLSFNGNKILTTSAGGALICSDKEDREKVLFWSQQSKEPALHFEHHTVGYNYRMSNILAAIGVGQMNRFEEIQQSKLTIYKRYVAAFECLGFFEVNEVVLQGNCWLSVFLIKKEFLQLLNPEELVLELRKSKIEARRFWKPMHQQVLLDGVEIVGGAVSDDLFDRGVCLPSGSAMSQSQQEFVIEKITELIKKSIS